MLGFGIALVAVGALVVCVVAPDCADMEDWEVHKERGKAMVAGAGAMALGVIIAIASRLP